MQRPLGAASPALVLIVLSLSILSAVETQSARAGAQSAAKIQATEIKGVLIADGGFIRIFDSTTPGFLANFDSEGYGAFEWQILNPGNGALQNAKFLIFLDADIEREENTFFNEFGSLTVLSLPPGAPSGAVGPSSWEIDEPGFLIGDIAAHLESGLLDTSNGIADISPDDVSLALGFNR